MLEDEKLQENHAPLENIEPKSSLSEHDDTSSSQHDVPPSPIPPDGGTYAWMTVAATSLVFFNTWGLVQAFGAYQAYYTTGLLSHLNASTISWIGTIQSFLLVSGGVITGPVFDQGYFRPLVVVGSVMIVFGMMMLSLAREYWQILLAQGVCVGLGSGMLFTPGLAQITISFNKRRPIALGLAMMGTGFGGIIYPIVFDHLVVKIGFAWTTRVIAFIAFATLTLAVTVLCWRSVDKRPPRSLFDFAALKEAPFVIYGISTFFTFTGYWIPWFFIPLYGRFAVGRTPTFSAYLLSITNAASIVGRLSTPLLQRWLSPLQVLVIVHILGDVLVWAWIGIGDSFGGFVSFCVFWGLFSGPMAVLPAAAVAELSPSLNVVGTRMGMVWAVSSFGNLIGTPIAGAVSDPTNDNFLGGQIYSGACLLTALGLIVATVLLMRTKSNRKQDGP